MKAQDSIFLICSAMVTDIGTVRLMAANASWWDRGRRSERASKAAESTACSISAPEKPRVELASREMLKSARALFCAARWMRKIYPFPMPVSTSFCAVFPCNSSPTSSRLSLNSVAFLNQMENSQ